MLSSKELICEGQHKRNIIVSFATRAPCEGKHKWNNYYDDSQNVAPASVNKAGQSLFRSCALPPTLFSFIEVFGARVGDLRRQQVVHFGAMDWLTLRKYFA